MSSCCSTNNDGHNHGKKASFDWLLWGSLTIIVGALLVHFTLPQLPYLGDFAHGVTSLLKKMWWGVLFGLAAVGMMHKVPRSLFRAVLGRGDTFGGLLRAALGGLLLDLCSHGILMVGAKLYERGASLAQVMTFLIASPWNSFSLTLILIALIGLKWTLLFIVGSVVIALITGSIFLFLERTGVLPENPYAKEEAQNTDEDAQSASAEFKAMLKKISFKPKALACFGRDVFRDGFAEGRMVLRWLFFGVILAALINAYVPTDVLTTYFGPSLVGLVLTLVATTIIEVCSEGSAPIGAELMNRAGAPGNGFTFLMAGVATDYTELLVIREFTKRWKTALFLPLVTTPQILVIGYIMNVFGT